MANRKYNTLETKNSYKKTKKHSFEDGQINSGQPKIQHQ